jgi:putative two-component system response regulator
MRHREDPTRETAEFTSRTLRVLKRLPSSYFPPERADILLQIATLAYLNGETRRAVRLGSQAIACAVRGRHRRVEARARMIQGTFLGEAYDFVGSLRQHAKAVKLAREDGDSELEAKALHNLASGYSDAGELGRAMATFQRLAEYWRSRGDKTALRMALQNAALAAHRLGDIESGLKIGREADAFAPRTPGSALEQLAIAQLRYTYAMLLVDAGSFEEAAEQASISEAAVASAYANYNAHAETLVHIGKAVTGYLIGTSDEEDIAKAIARARTQSPNLYWSALDSAIRAFRAAGEPDKALALQTEMLEFTKREKYQSVRSALGHASSEESEDSARLVNLAREVDQTLDNLVNTAIGQSLRAGYDHFRIFRVGRLAELFAGHVGCPERQVRSINLAAKLMDIGTMIVSDELLNARRDLSGSERELIVQHATFGATMLEKSRLAVLHECVPAVRFHHERWDGTGAARLHGAQIPFEARLIALCDVFDSLTHERPWRPACDVGSALSVIEQQRSSVFDPDLAERFVAWLQAYSREVPDLDYALSEEARTNGFVRIRNQIDRLLRNSSLGDGEHAEPPNRPTK